MGIGWWRGRCGGGEDGQLRQNTKKVGKKRDGQKNKRKGTSAKTGKNIEQTQM